MEHKNTIIKLLLIFFAISLHTSAFSQIKRNKTTLTGKTIDSKSNEIIPFVTISILDTKTNKSVAREVADGDGTFKINIPNKGDFQLIIKTFNYEKYTKNFTLNAKKRTYNFGNIKLEVSDQQLDEVVVSDVKSLVRTEANKIIYSSENDPNSDTNSALETLRKVPMLSVDGDDKIRLNGKTNFKIFINGKESAMTKSDPSTFLQSLPANTVKEIEVISSPGAKYDAEGIGGIINIITKTKKTKGYTLNIGASASTLKRYNSYLYGSAAWGRFAISANMGLGVKSKKPAYQDYTRENFNNNVAHLINSDGERSREMISQYTNINMSFDIDSLNLISSEINFWHGDFDIDNSSQNSILDINNSLQQAYNIMTNKDINYKSMDFSLDYQHMFKKDKKRLLTLSAKYSGEPHKYDIKQNIDSVLNFPRNMLTKHTDEENKEYTFQVDYEHPISKYFIFNVGSKVIIRKNSSLFKHNDFNFKTNKYENNASRFVDFSHTQDVEAMYVSFNGNLTDRLGYQAGVRAENSVTKGFFTTKKNLDFEHQSLDFVPSVSLSYQLNARSSMQLSYDKRIHRPSIHNLNPTIDDQNPQVINVGNPELDNESYHAFELLFYTGSSIGSFTASAFYEYTNNGIGNITRINDKGVTLTTFENLLNQHSVGMGLSTNLFISKNFGLNTNITVNYDMMSDNKNQDLSNNSLNVNTYISARYNLPKSFKLFASGYYYRFGGELQESPYTFYNYDFGISKGFFKNKLQFKFVAANVFSKYHYMDFEVNDKLFHHDMSIKRYARQFKIAISYRLGKLKNSVKKTKHSIENTDVLHEDDEG